MHILNALERSLEPSIDDFIDAMEAMTMIQTTVEDVLIRVPSEEPEPTLPGGLGPESATKPRLVLLRERDGERMLPIWTGFPEADSLAAQLAGRKRPRPLTFELMAAAGVSHDVDARPSDALNLASRVGVPVLVDRVLMDEHGVASLEDMESRIIAKAESDLRKAPTPAWAERARLTAHSMVDSGEWRSLPDWMRRRASAEEQGER